MKIRLIPVLAASLMITPYILEVVAPLKNHSTGFYFIVIGGLMGLFESIYVGFIKK